MLRVTVRKKRQPHQVSLAEQAERRMGKRTTKTGCVPKRRF